MDLKFYHILSRCECRCSINENSRKEETRNDQLMESFVLVWNHVIFLFKGHGRGTVKHRSKYRILKPTYSNHMGPYPLGKLSQMFDQICEPLKLGSRFVGG